MTNYENFVSVLTKHYADLFQTVRYQMAAQRYTPRAMAEKFTAGLLDKTANKDGDGIKRTCKELGINHTYKAIQAYLKG